MKVAVLGTETSIGSAMVWTLISAGVEVCRNPQAEEIPSDCRLLLYCRLPDEARGDVEELCRRLAASRRVAAKQLHVCCFSPINVCRGAKTPIRENAPLQPLSSRDLKYACVEMTFHAWSAISHGLLQVHVFRHGELYATAAEKSELQGHLASTLRQVQLSDKLPFPGLAHQRRTLTHLDDFAQAVVLLLQKDFIPEVINIPGETMTVADYLFAIGEHYGVMPIMDEPQFSDDYPRGLGDRVLSAATFKKELPSFRAQHSFRAWLEQQPKLTIGDK